MFTLDAFALSANTVAVAFLLGSWGEQGKEAAALLAQALEVITWR